jgi:hypothetical protein
MQADRLCDRANQAAAPKFLSAFICVHPRQNILSFGAKRAGLAHHPGAPPAASRPPAALPGTAVQGPRSNAVQPERQTIATPAAASRFNPAPDSDVDQATQRAPTAPHDRTRRRPNAIALGEY